jgi:hypothetical protein
MVYCASVHSHRRPSLSQFRTPGDGEQCLSKQWIVKKEQAGAGRDCPATRLVQWQIGTVVMVMVMVMVMVGCFGKDWYDACLVG